ncbi:MAG: hypothetical protein LBM92_00920, partial [Opitutaceae bacterium]|nr:hypothetical protein [Opitutaceae bacterium]
MHKLLLAIFFLPPFLVCAESPDAMEDWCNANASRENISKRAQQHAIYLRVMAAGQMLEYFELFSDKTLDELYNLHRSQSHTGINFSRTQWRGETKTDVL